MMETKQTLKPCPFCGGHAKITKCCHPYGIPHSYAVTCTECAEQSAPRHNIDEAREVWNTRTDPARDDLVAALEGLLFQDSDLSDVEKTKRYIKARAALAKAKAGAK